MSDGIGLAETIEEARIVERNTNHALARERATHLHCGRRVRFGEHGVLEPELVDGAENIGAKLDAGAKFLEFRRLFQQSYRKPFAGERIGRREPTDAATGNQDGQSLFTAIGTHPASPDALGSPRTSKVLAAFAGQSISPKKSGTREAPASHEPENRNS